MTISEKLTMLREAKGLTKQALVDDLKINYSTYANYESGTREPNSEMLKLIANYYDVSIDFILGLTDSPRRAETIQDIGEESSDSFISGKQDLGKRIKEARINKGITQEELGKAIGVAKSTVAGYESGNSNPDVSKMYSIMETLGVDANFLYQDEMISLENSTKKATLEDFESGLFGVVEELDIPASAITPAKRKLLLDIAKLIMESDVE